MNFLAHLLLSNQDEDLMIGNFIADSVRSVEWGKFKPEVVEGIKLHHSIDEFTDSHPIVDQSKQRIREVQGKYSPVVVDILYDHFLAKNFNNYSNIELDSFVQSAYKLFRSRYSELPKQVQHMLPYMERYNWLYNYGNREGLQGVFNGMHRRANFKNNMHKSVDQLYEDYADFEKDFESFYPQLVENTQTQLAIIRSAD